MAEKKKWVVATSTFHHIEEFDTPGQARKYIKNAIASGSKPGFLQVMSEKEFETARGYIDAYLEALAEIEEEA